MTVACTRKAAPLSRALAIKAVRAGGGVMHRTGLSDTVLVFPEHRAFLPDTTRPRWWRALRARAPERKLVVEVTDMTAPAASPPPAPKCCNWRNSPPRWSPSWPPR